MSTRIVAAAFAAFALVAAAAEPAGPGDFLWRASLDVPANTGLARVELPAGALARLQSADARDVRVFNAAGEAVPFAWITPPPSDAKPSEQRTRSYRALPLYVAPPQATGPTASTQVRIEGQSGSVWVRMDGAQPAGARKLDSVIFATRGEEQCVAAIDVEATLPANTPVRVNASTSADLASWTALAVRGRLYRFEGADAPANLRIAFDTPVDLKDRYLRLDWTGQDGVTITSVTGVVANAAAAPHRLRVELPAARQTAADAIEIDTGFATRMAGLAIEAQRDNTLVPVRVLGRGDASQPWRTLGQTVVYRIGPGNDRMDNPPLDLHGASARSLRIQSTNGSAIQGAQWRVSAEFDPAQLVFVASGAGPFTLAAGHRDVTSAALPASTITGLLGARKLDDLPLAKAGPALETPQAAGPFDWIPGAPGKSTVLWVVLLAGVLILGGVAWSLLRQTSRGAQSPP
jgi:hypothetical protein